MSIALLMKLCSSAGLLLDILGVLMLWRFGLPPDVRRYRTEFAMLERNDPHEIEITREYERLSRTAVALLVAGFVLQFIHSVWDLLDY